MPETPGERLDQFVKFLQTIAGCEAVSEKGRSDARDIVAEIETLQQQNAAYREALEALRCDGTFRGWTDPRFIVAEAIRLADALREAGREGV